MKTTFHSYCLPPVFAAALLSLPLVILPQISFAQEATEEATEEETGISRFIAEEDPPAFDDADAAIDAFKSALAADDFDGVARLLGLDTAPLREDETTMENYAKIRDGAADMLVAKDLGDSKIIEIGNQLWPLPFPVVKGDDGKWSFDTFAGLQEILNRRVGENELEAIATARAYVDAQHDYAEEDRDGDGVLEYAQKIISSKGETDGLYWPADQGDGESPVGEFANQAALETAVEGEGYFGYRFRILTSQGDNIAGGSYDYVINGNMIAGFALIAWPVTYAETGVKTFVVSHHNTVYEKDLGPATAEIVKYIERFNPDDSWEVVTAGL